MPLLTEPGNSMGTLFYKDAAPTALPNPGGGGNRDGTPPGALAQG